MARMLLLVLGAVVVATASAINPMPFRPGYGLGSWLPDPVIDSMKREAATRSEILIASNIDNDILSVQQELQLAHDPRTREMEDNIPAPFTDEAYNKTMNKLQATRQRVWSKKIDALNDLVDEMEKQLDTLNGTARNGTSTEGAFTTFATGAQTAVNWPTSRIAQLTRAFDSINIDMQYVQAKSHTDRRHGRTDSSQLNAALREMAKNALGQDTATSVEAEKRARRQAESFFADNSVKGTLLLTAFATHRKVMQFDRLGVNPDLLRKAWNHYKVNQSVADPLSQWEQLRDQFNEERTANVTLNATDKLHMVSEVFKGSALVGMVHFLQTDETKTSNLFSEVVSGISTSNNTGRTVLDGDTHEDVDRNKKDASEAFQNARRVVKLASEAKYNIKFNLVCVGFTPKLTPGSLEMTVKELADFDPGKFRVPAIVEGDNKADALEAVRQNMGAVVEATVTSVAKSTQDMKEVLDVNTFMNAFTDYATAAQEGKDSIGAPSGFNVREFTKLDVLSALANKYLGTGFRMATDQSDPALPAATPAGTATGAGTGTTGTG